MEHQLRNIPGMLTIAGYSLATLALFIVALLYFPLEFLAVSIVAILSLLRSIEKEIDAMDDTQYGTMVKK